MRLILLLTLLSPAQTKIALIGDSTVNDGGGKGPYREADPATTFRDNLLRYVQESRTIDAMAAKEFLELLQPR